MKIYRVVLQSKYLPAGEDEVEITTFLNKELAEQYIKESIENLKREEELLGNDTYKKIERENYYERYLNANEMDNSVSIYLEEDETYDEIKKKKKAERLEKETNYEM